MQAAFATQAVKLDPLRQPEGIKRLLCRYRVGGETILGEAGGRLPRTVANLMVVAWNALTAGHKLGFLRPVGWGLRLLRILALAVVRAPLGGRAAAERHSRCQPRASSRARTGSGSVDRSGGVACGRCRDPLLGDLLAPGHPVRTGGRGRHLGGVQPGRRHHPHLRQPTVAPDG